MLGKKHPSRRCLARVISIAPLPLAAFRPPAAVQDVGSAARACHPAWSTLGTPDCVPAANLDALLHSIGVQRGDAVALGRDIVGKDRRPADTPLVGDPLARALPFVGAPPVRGVRFCASGSGGINFGEWTDLGAVREAARAAAPRCILPSWAEASAA